jgi:hypothetical protein
MYDELSPAIVRALSALSRSSASGRLEIAVSDRRATVVWVGGVVRALSLHPSEDDAIGDVLHRSGDFDAENHRRALGHGAPRGPVGRWLVEAQVASAPSLAHALRRQLKHRMSIVLGWRRAELSFTDSMPEGLELVDEPVAIGDLVLGAARERARSTGAGAIRGLERVGELAITELGKHLVERASLGPEEAVLVRVLSEKALPARECIAIAGGGSRAGRALVTLMAAHAAAVARASSSDTRMLFEKRMQIERRESPEELLGLRSGSTHADARKALRRLVRVLHPDRFHTDDAMRRTSEKVLTALLAAERDLRDRPRR